MNVELLQSLINQFEDVESDYQGSIEDANHCYARAAPDLAEAIKEIVDKEDERFEQSGDELSEEDYALLDEAKYALERHDDIAHSIEYS